MTVISRDWRYSNPYIYTADSWLIVMLGLIRLALIYKDYIAKSIAAM
jgi:hypothetical protein